MGYIDCNIYLFSKLNKGHIINGPAVIMDKLSTILVEPKCKAIISKSGDIGKYLIVLFLWYVVYFNMHFF